MAQGRLLELRTIHGMNRNILSFIQTAFLLLFGFSPSSPHPFIHSNAFFTAVIDKLLHVAFFQKSLNNCQLSQLLRLWVKLHLFFYDQSISVFQCVLCPPLKVAGHFGPLFLAFILFDDAQQKQVFFFCPRTFLQVRIQIAIPMLPTLFRATINFIWVRVHKVQFLRNYAPVSISIFSIINAFLLRKFFQELRLSFSPSMLRQIILFQAEPLKHASFCLNSWDDGSNIFPILDRLHKKRIYKILVDGVDAFKIGIFGNSPDEDFDILFTPIFLEFFIFYHSAFKYFILFNSISDHLLNDLGTIVVVDLKFGSLAMLKNVVSKFVFFHLLHLVDEFDQSRAGLKHFLNVVLGKDFFRLELGSLLLTLKLRLRHHDFESKFSI